MATNECIFCNIEEKRILFSDEHFYIIKDNYPVSPGHMLIISKRHVEEYFHLNKTETDALHDVILKAKGLVEAEHKPDGYNIGMNCSQSAGQTIMHFHCHLIPRYKGDVENPRGGVRHVISGKGYY